jgi:hypothetical protein
MNEPPESPQPYRVSYSDRVREAAFALASRIRGTFLETSVRHALSEIERRLKIYPQFGEPLKDLAARKTTLWIGTVPPLVVHYILDEEKRQVIVVRPFQSLSRSEL